MIILTPKQMNQLDTYVINQLKIPGMVLMEHAAMATAQKATQMLEGVVTPKVVVFAGTGNNGGDGFAMARLLENKGVKTIIYLFGEQDKVKGDARLNLEICVAMGLKLIVYQTEKKDECIRNVQESDLAVDALLGTGYTGALRQPVADGISILNAYGKKVLSVDIPSGVNGLDGSVTTEAVKACETVTFCCPKPGICVYPGRELAGCITVASIQIPKSTVERMNSDMLYIDENLVRKWLQVRKADGNKGDYGRVTVTTGTGGMTGAAILAAKAAYRTGSGLVYMLTDPCNMSVLETAAIEAVKVPISSDLEKELNRISDFLDKQDCVVIGPGMGNNERTERIVRTFLARGGNLVLDADGLNVLEGKIELLRESPCHIVITPHPGEMSRLCGKSISEVQKDRLGTAFDFAKKTGVTVVLKGASTVLCTPNVQLINSTGCPGMSVAGSGDVLSGMIGSLIGQGLPILKACALGAYLHGLAGEYAQVKFTEYGVTASDIIDMIPSAYKAIGRNYISPKGRFDLTCT